jgi:hypothetical protein
VSLAQGAVKMEQDIVVIAPRARGNTLILAGLATSMAVNILGTGLMAFKIFKVLLEYEPTSVKGTLDWLKKNGVTDFCISYS